MLKHFHIFIQKWMTKISRRKGMIKSSRPEVLLRKGVLKTCSKFTGEHPCRSVISIKLLCNFVKIPLRHRCSPVTLLHIFRTPFSKNTSGWMLLYLCVNLFKNSTCCMIWSYLVHFSAQTRKLKKNPSRKKFLIFQEWNFLNLRLRNFLYFLKRKLFLYVRE